MIVELLSRAVEGGLEKLGFENMPITHSQRNKHQLHLQQIRDAPKEKKKNDVPFYLQMPDNSYIARGNQAIESLFLA